MTMKRKDEWLRSLDRKALLECVLAEWSKQRDHETRRGRKAAIEEPGDARQVAQLVDDQEFGLGVEAKPLLERALNVRDDHRRRVGHAE